MVIRLTTLVAFILTTTTEAYVNIKVTSVVKFIKNNNNNNSQVRHSQGIHNRQCPQFISQQMNELCTKYDIELHHSTPYYPQANGKLKQPTRPY